MILIRSLFCLALVLCIGLTGSAVYAGNLPEINKESIEKQLDEIEEIIAAYKSKGHIPGLAVVIVKDDQTLYSKGYGYKDAASKEPVTPSTLFEIGSNSKAFTGLAVMKLAEQGLIHLDDPVSRHIPWFQMKYRDVQTDITIQQLLHHTSGIPYSSIERIPESDEPTALEETVRTLLDQPLKHMPGEKYEYATINYDVLGLVIQQVTGQSYETYMKEELLAPLGLEQTYLTRLEAPSAELSKGYKINFLRQAEYEAPIYRGNLPAGYILSNANDIARWLQIQMNAVPVGVWAQTIAQSHLPDRTIEPHGDGASYASGWQVYQDGKGELSHGGNNPNFSSFLTFRPEEKVGVAVLANTNSLYTETIGKEIMDVIKGKSVTYSTSDTYLNLDRLSLVIICVAIPFLLLTLWNLTVMVRELLRKQRQFNRGAGKSLASILIFLLFTAGFAFAIYQIPRTMLGGLSWEFVGVWGPATFTLAAGLLVAMVSLFSFYVLMLNLSRKQSDHSVFPLVILSLFSGFGNALIIFIINAALNREDRLESHMYLYFLVGIVLYVFGQRLIRTRFIQLTNELIYTQRISIVDKILRSPFRKMERIEHGKIQTVLNNDTESISNVINVLVTGLTSIITLLFCFIYLGLMNVYGLLLSVTVIVIAAGLFFLVGKSANRLWEQTRDIQNAFFNYINDLIHGFKELSLSREKRAQFKQDMVDSCGEYKTKRVQGDLKFATVSVMGELLFTIVIGVVVFLFASLITGMPTESLRSYVFVFLYMTGPVNSVLNSIPQFFQMKISWKRILEMNELLSGEKDERASDLQPEVLPEQDKEKVHLQLKGVTFEYKHQNGSFHVGPIDFECRNGEVVFITGGNGSGKSTLGKLLCGLYEPDEGRILMNGVQVDGKQLTQYYSAIFSDFHLFDKLYGVPYKELQEQIESYLRLLHLENKVEIVEGRFSTTDLSTGQKKRLALFIAYLENRPIYLFDEWAADQDPEYREFFYTHLLKELKAQGKCVIAITHDDRYFHLADKVVKMDLGLVVDNKIAIH